MRTHSCCALPADSPGVDADLQSRLAEDFPLQLAVPAMEGGPLQALGLQLFGEGGVIQLAQRLQRGGVIGVVEAQLQARLLPAVQQYAALPVAIQTDVEAIQGAAAISLLQGLAQMPAHMLHGQVGQLPAVLDQAKYGLQDHGRILWRPKDAVQGGIARDMGSGLFMGTRGQAGKADGQGKGRGRGRHGQRLRGGGVNSGSTAQQDMAQGRLPCHRCCRPCRVQDHRSGSR